MSDVSRTLADCSKKPKQRTSSRWSAHVWQWNRTKHVFVMSCIFGMSAFGERIRKQPRKKELRKYLREYGQNRVSFFKQSRSAFMLSMFGRNWCNFVSWPSVESVVSSELWIQVLRTFGFLLFGTTLNNKQFHFAVPSVTECHFGSLLVAMLKKHSWNQLVLVPCADVSYSPPKCPARSWSTRHWCKIILRPSACPLGGSGLSVDRPSDP